MPLPSSGQISADDLNDELGNSPGTQIDFQSAADDFGVSSIGGIGFDEFYGLSAGYNFAFSDWDGGVSINEFGVISYTQGNASSVTVNTSNFGAITSTTTQTVSVTIVAPSTFEGQSVDNAGSPLTDNVSTTQPAVGRYLSISADGGDQLTPLTGDDTSVALTVTDTYYSDTPWEINTQTLGPNSISVVSFLPVTGTGDETVNVSIADNPNGSLRNIRFIVTGTVGGKTAYVDVYQDTYTPVYAPTISIDSVSPSSPYSYSGAPQIVVTVSKTEVSSFTSQISPGIDGNSAIFSSIQPGGVTRLNDTNISSTSNTFYIEIPARSDGGLDIKESFLSVSVTNTAGSDSDSYTLSQQGQTPIWSLGTLPTLQNSSYSKSELTTFSKNVPYTFDYESVNFDKTNFGFYIDEGAGISLTSRTLSTATSFTVTKNGSLLDSSTTLNYTVGEKVSVQYSVGNATTYGIATITSWNGSTLGVSFISTYGNTTTSYNAWEIHQISGDGSSTPYVYTRKVNDGLTRNTTIKLNDTNNDYGLGELSGTLTQNPAPLEYNWFLNGVQRTGNSVSVSLGSTAGGYSVGLYAFRGSTADATLWQLDVTGGTSWIDVNTTTSGGGNLVSTTTSQNTNGTPYLYINVAENTTSSTRTGSVDILGLDGAYIATISISQSGASGGGDPSDKPDPGDQL